MNDNAVFSLRLLFLFESIFYLILFLVKLSLKTQYGNAQYKWTKIEDGQREKEKQKSLKTTKTNGKAKSLVKHKITSFEGRRGKECVWRDERGMNPYLSSNLKVCN